MFFRDRHMSTAAGYGLKLDLGLRRHFPWNFLIANVQSPIIGADFLHHHNLLVDLKHKRLIDSTTSVSTSGTIVTVSGIESVHLMPPDHKYADILKQLPNVLHENIYFSPTPTTVTRLRQQGTQ
jgi:cleavage and polyadenylation specificity factor subunit 1